MHLRVSHIGLRLVILVLAFQGIFCKTLLFDDNSSEVKSSDIKLSPLFKYLSIGKTGDGWDTVKKVPQESHVQEPSWNDPSYFEEPLTRIQTLINEDDWRNGDQNPQAKVRYTMTLTWDHDYESGEMDLSHELDDSLDHSQIRIYDLLFGNIRNSELGKANTGLLVISQNLQTDDKGQNFKFTTHTQSDFSRDEAYVNVDSSEGFEAILEPTEGNPDDVPKELEEIIQGLMQLEKITDFKACCDHCSCGCQDDHPESKAVNLEQDQSFKRCCDHCSCGCQDDQLQSNSDNLEQEQPLKRCCDHCSCGCQDGHPHSEA